MLQEMCSICLETRGTVRKTNETDENGFEPSSSLGYLVPEVDWMIEYKICHICVTELKNACRFREQCLNILNAIKTEQFCYKTEQNHISSPIPEDNLADHDDSSDDSSDIKEDPPVEDEQDEREVFICFHCDAKFNFKKQIKEHIQRVHSDRQDTVKYKRTEECLECGRKFAKKESLKEHSMMCDGVNRHNTMKREHQCDKCKRFYTTEKILKAHRKRCMRNIIGNFDESENEKDNKDEECRSDKKMVRKRRKKDEIKKECDSLVCKMCDEAFETILELRKHVSLDHKQERIGRFTTFTCDICSQRFNFVRAIIDHYVKVHSIEEKEVKPYSCDVCNKRFRVSTNLTIHKLHHEGKRMNICSICGKSFITKHDLLRHEMIHYSERNYKCDKCEKSFKTDDNLRKHCLIVHTDPMLWKYVCHICGKRFPVKSNHDIHVRRHIGEKNFSCSLCKKAFVTRKEMREHVINHTNDRRFRCDQCGKEYRNKKGMDIHLTKAHGIGNAKIPVRERKHACHICPARFPDRSKLARHLGTHSGLKPYSCYSCERKFTDKSYLKQHLQKSHNIFEVPSDSFREPNTYRELADPMKGEFY